MVDNDKAEVEEERGFIQEPKRRSLNVMNGILVGLVAIIAASALYFVLNLNKEKEVKEEPKLLMRESVPEYKLPPPVKVAEPEPEPEPEVETVKEVVIAPMPVPQKPVKEKDNMLERLLNAELGSKVQNDNSLSSNGANLRQSEGEGGLSNIDFSVSQTPIVQASRLSNLNWIVPKGIPIPCALNTAIQSDQSGLITCTTTEDIYSADGTVILIDRGSTGTGEYRTSSISLGKSRIFAIWDRIRTPDGVVININSPATGALGRAGIGGYIDNHYLERFGAAILVSLIDDAFESGTDNSDFDNTSDEFRNVSGEFLRQYQRIRPTLHKPQGGEVNIMVARDLDLSTVYSLRQK